MDKLLDITNVDLIIGQLIKGGFPRQMNSSVAQSADINRAYVELLADVDMSRVSQTKRDQFQGLMKQTKLTHIPCHSTYFQ